MTIWSIRFNTNGQRAVTPATAHGSTEFTWCCWFKWNTDNDTWGPILCCDPGPTGVYNSLALHAAGNFMRYTNGGDITSSYIPPLGVWGFIACTQTASAPDAIFWRFEGVHTSLQTLTGPPEGSVITPATSTFYIGKDGYNSTVLGSIACVKVWTAALTSAELAAERLSVTPVRTASLWASWSFANGVQTNDESGNGHTLTITGTPVTDTAGPPLEAQAAVNPAGADHAHSAANVVLTQTHHLVVANGAHAHTAANVTLNVGGVDLAVNAATHAHTADNVTITPIVGTGTIVAVVTTANIVPSGEAATAQLTPPTGKVLGDYSVGRIWDDENGVDPIIIGGSAFIETFADLSHWTPARQGSQPNSTPQPVGWLNDFTPALLDHVNVPNDIVIVDEQLWIGTGSQNYGDSYVRCNQPMEFADGGTINLDVWIQEANFLLGWSHLTVTADPYTSPSSKSDNSAGPTPRYGFEVRFNYTQAWDGVWHPAPRVIVWDEYIETLIDGAGLPLPIDTTPHTMTAVRIEFDHTEINIYANGGLWLTTPWSLPTEMTSGWVYLSQHNHASLKYSNPVGSLANTYCVFGGLRFSGTVLPERRCFKVPDSLTTPSSGEVGTNGVNIGWTLPATLTIPGVPAGITSARLLCSTGCWGGFIDASTRFTYALNGNTPHALQFPEWDGTTYHGSGVAIWSIPVLLSELVAGSNLVAFSMTTISGPQPYVFNVQLLTEGGT